MVVSRDLPFLSEEKELLKSLRRPLGGLAANRVRCPSEADDPDVVLVLEGPPLLGESSSIDSTGVCFDARGAALTLRLGAMTRYPSRWGAVVVVKEPTPPRSEMFPSSL